MFVCNITIKIDPQIETEWLEWEKNEDIPEVLATGFFNDCKFFRLLDPEEKDGIIYVVQYFTSSLEQYEKYIQKYAPLQRKKAFDRWGNQFIAFRTVMQAVN